MTAPTPGLVATSGVVMRALRTTAAWAGLIAGVAVWCVLAVLAYRVGVHRNIAGFVIILGLVASPVAALFSWPTPARSSASLLRRVLGIAWVTNIYVAATLAVAAISPTLKGGYIDRPAGASLAPEGASNINAIIAVVLIGNLDWILMLVLWRRRTGWAPAPAEVAARAKLRARPVLADFKDPAVRERVRHADHRRNVGWVILLSSAGVALTTMAFTAPTGLTLVGAVLLVIATVAGAAAVGLFIIPAAKTIIDAEFSSAPHVASGE